MTPLRRKRRIRKKRGTSWTSESSARANKARWDAERARRDAEMPERILEQQEIEIRNLPRKQGDAVGCLQYHDFATGKITRWVVEIGDRTDRRVLRTPDGRRSKSHGWAFLFRCVRMVILGNFLGLKVKVRST